MRKILRTLLPYLTLATTACAEDDRPSLESAVDRFIAEHSPESMNCGTIGNHNCSPLTAGEQQRLQCFLEAAQTCQPSHLHISSLFVEEVGGLPFDRWYFTLPDGDGCSVHLLETPREPKDYLLHEQCLDIQPAPTCFMIDPLGCVHVELIEIDRVEELER